MHNSSCVVHPFSSKHMSNGTFLHEQHDQCKVIFVEVQTLMLVLADSFCRCGLLFIYQQGPILTAAHICCGNMLNLVKSCKSQGMALDRVLAGQKQSPSLSKELAGQVSDI